MNQQLLIDFLLHRALCPEGHINKNAYNFYLRKICRNNFVCIFKKSLQAEFGKFKKKKNGKSREWCESGCNELQV